MDSRTADRADPDRAGRSRRAARIGPRSCTGQPAVRRSRQARNTLPSRACAGQAPRAVGRRRPTTRSASPARTGSATRGSWAGSNEPSASMKHTTRRRVAAPDRRARRRRTALPHRTTVAPRAAAMRAEPSVDPLSATIARYPSGSRRRSPGRAAASFRQGRTTRSCRDANRRGERRRSNRYEQTLTYRRRPGRTGSRRHRVVARAHPRHRRRRLHRLARRRPADGGRP